MTIVKTGERVCFLCKDFGKYIVSSTIGLPFELFSCDMHLEAVRELITLFNEKKLDEQERLVKMRMKWEEEREK